MHIYIYIYMCAYVYSTPCICVYIYIYTCVLDYGHPLHNHDHMQFVCIQFLGSSSKASARLHRSMGEWSTLTDTSHRRHLGVVRDVDRLRIVFSMYRLRDFVLLPNDHSERLSWKYTRVLSPGQIQNSSRQLTQTDRPRDDIAGRKRRGERNDQRHS